MRPPAREAHDDLPNRRVAWNALSDLYLDTDVALSRQWRAESLASLPYSIDEIEWILVREVQPIVRWNLYSVAGEWAGFDGEWLEAEILRLLRSRQRWPSPFRGRRVSALAIDEWEATKQLVAEIRNRIAPAES